MNSERPKPAIVKLRINQQEMAQKFYDETRLLGIVAPIESYKFCWHLNQLLNFDFRTRPDLEISMNNRGRSYYFSIYQYKKPLTSIVHSLYENHDDGEFLLPELRHFDYLWLIKYDQVDEEEMSLFIDSVKSIPVLQMVTELSIERLKSRENLFF